MFAVNNVKISCKINQISLEKIKSNCLQEGISFQTYCNFIVFRSKGFTFTIFKPKIKQDSLKDCKKIQHVNITKCLLHTISDALKALSEIVSCNPSSLDYSIDTITASGHLNYKLKLGCILKNKINSEKMIWNPEKFPGLFISRERGVKAILFSSGSFVIIGCKNLKHIEKTKEWMTQKTVHTNIN